MKYFNFLIIHKHVRRQQKFQSAKGRLPSIMKLLSYSFYRLGTGGGGPPLGRLGSEGGGPGGGAEGGGPGNRSNGYS